MKVIYKFFSILLNLLFNDKSNFLLIFVVIIILYILVPIFIVLVGICLRGCYIAFADFNWDLLTSIDISLSTQEKYDSLFSPVTAFFSAVGTAFTAIVLINQFKSTKIQLDAIKRQNLTTKIQAESIRIQREESIINNFNSQLNMMISMRTDITNSVILVDEKGKTEIGKTVFHTLVDRMYKSSDNKKRRIWDNSLKGDKDNLEKVFDDFINKFSNYIISDKNLLKVLLSDINSRIDDLTKGTLSPFFHNVYTILRIINDNRYLNPKEKKKYFRMIRSHFTQSEFILIYYHALTHIDEGGRKFKQLIENTCFFHSLIQEYIPIPIPIHDDSKKNVFGYSYRAFFHNKAEYLEYLDRQKKSKNIQSQNR